MRRDWAKLVDQTNEARDWDTLVIYLEQHLAAEVVARHCTLLTMRQAQAQQQVLDTLRARLWSSTSSRWNDYLRCTGADNETALPWHDIIATARVRAREAWENASEMDDKRSWHRLRIAIKDLRYSLDTLAPDSPGTQATINLCKELQTLLGDWHDTVVHRQLLEQLASGEAILAEKEAAQVLLSVLPDLQTRGSDCLERVRQLLESGGLA